MPVISIVGSCKNEEDNINELYSQISQLFDNELNSQNLELIFIDNASTDKTVKIIKEICKKDNRVKLIENVKDYGQDKSPYHAFIQSSGDYVVPIVTDLQDPIKIINQLYSEIQNSDYDMILAVPIVEKDGFNFLQKNARAKKARIHFFGIYESPKDTNSIFLQAKNAQTCANSKC